MSKLNKTKMDNLGSEKKSFFSFFSPVLVASQFLTLMPPIIRPPFTLQELGRSVGAFPLVGLFIGGILAGTDSLLSIILPPSVKAVLLLAIWIVLTGALHLDGFLDSCDGLFGGRTPERRLEIMRDESIGAYAFAGGILLILTKFTALVSLSSLTIPLLLTPLFGRWAISLVIVLLPYGRVEGLGRAMKDHATWIQLAQSALIAVSAAWFFSQWIGLVALGLTAVVAFGIAAFVLRRIPGLTGDIYGAICECSETIVLLLFVIIGRSS